MSTSNEPSGRTISAAQDTLRRVEGGYRPLVSQVRDYAVLTIDLDGKVSSWNAGCKTVLGYSEQELIGMDFRQLFTPGDRTAGVPDRELLTAKEHGRANNDRWMMGKHGRFFAGGITTAVKGPDGAVVSYTKIMRDHTEWKRLEERLVESEQRYRGLLDAIDEGFCVVELVFEGEGDQRRAVDFYFLEVNPAFERHSGLADVVGRGVRELLHGSEAEWVRTYAEVALSGTSQRFEREAAGLGRWFDVYAFPVIPVAPGTGGGLEEVSDDPAAAPAVTAAPPTIPIDPPHVAVLFTDITQRRTIADALLRANLEMERFTALASHDLKEPLRGIASLVRFMTEDEPALTEVGRGRLERVFALAVRLNQMVDGLLEYARAGGAGEHESCDLTEVVREALATLTPALRPPGADVVVCPPLPTVSGDRLMLERAFANLIINALRYNESPVKRVEIGFQDGEVYVRDNGVGVLEKDKESIFEVFRRGQLRRPGMLPDVGVGLGLAMVRRIITGHGGSVRVESNPGAGATFYLRFPTAPSIPVHA